MALNRNDTTPDPWERLRSDILAEPLPDSRGAHLDDNVAIRYSMDGLTPAQVAAADAHLTSCEACAGRVRHLLSVAAAWQGSEGEQRLDDLSDRVLSAIRAQDVALGMAPPAAAPAEERLSLQDGEYSSARQPAMIYRHPSWPRFWVPALASAAVVALAASAALLSFRPRPSTASSDNASARIAPPSVIDAPAGGLGAGATVGAPPIVAEPRPPAASPRNAAAAPARGETPAAARVDGRKPPTAGVIPAPTVRFDRLDQDDPGALATVLNPPSTPPAATDGVAAAADRPADAAAGTPFPPDLPDVPTARKRLVSVQPFEYSTVKPWVDYWFKGDTNIGEGVRSMLGARLQQSATIALLDRPNIQDVVGEQDFSASNRVKQRTGARIGGITGADAMLYGEIMIFGRDDPTKGRRVGAVVNRFTPLAGGVAAFNREEKAVVGITLRLVDTITGQVIETAEARGESSRKIKDYAGAFGVKGAVVADGTNMTSANFQQTIIGEATAEAVTKIVEYLEGRIPQLPAKARQIEGRVATISANRITVAIGGETGMVRGDRFEILQINGFILDPVTRQLIDVDTVKVGELVVDTVRDRTASGQYGGQPLSSAYVTAADKGYMARLMVPR